MDVVIDEYILRKLRERHIYNKRTGMSWNKPEAPQNRWKIGDKITFRRETAIEEFCTFGAGNSLYSCGSFSSVASGLPTNVKMGRYVGIGTGCSIIGFYHPIQKISGNSAFFNFQREYVAAYFREYEAVNGEVKKDKGVMPQQPRNKDICIGHDVWLGNDVTLSGGIKIGTGAVVAAKSVVTHDVPPFAIVAGIPATVRKYRFSTEIVKELLDSQWWEYELGDMYREELDFSNPKEFLRMFSKKYHKLRRYDPKIFYPFKEMVMRVEHVPADALLTEHGTILCLNEDEDKIVNERNIHRYLRAHVVDNVVSLSDVKGEKFISEIETDGKIKWSIYPKYFSIVRNADDTISLKKQNGFLSARKNGTVSFVRNNLEWEKFTNGLV